MSTDQGSKTWLEWRKKGIGGSDVASIMGLSPWKTKHQLWLEKTGQSEGKDISGEWQVRRGTENEGKARAHVELLLGVEFPPELAVHPKYDFMRVSLDGRKDQTILEIKCPSAKVMEQAALGKVPDYYMAQVQYQLMVTAADRCIFFCFHPESGRAARVDVLNNHEMQKEIEAAVIEFWECVKTLTAPTLSDADYKEIKDPTFTSMAKIWKSYQDDLKKLEEKIELVEKQLKAYTKEHPAIRGAGLKIFTVNRKGNVDYSCVPQLAGVDLEPYRKAGSTYVQIKRQRV